MMTGQSFEVGSVTSVSIWFVPIKAFFDIGGAGHNSDAMAIWIVQFIGRAIRVLDYIEGKGQPLSYYAHQLRSPGSFYPA